MGREANIDDTPDCEIAADVIVSLLRSRILSQRSALKMPSEAAISRLAFKMSYLKLTWRNWHPDEDLNSPLGEIFKLAKYIGPRLDYQISLRDLIGLKERLAEIEALNLEGEELHRDLLRYTYSAWELTVREAAALNELIAIDRDREALSKKVPKIVRDDPELNETKDLLPYLADEFTLAMKSSNPDVSIGISAQGPLAKFASAMIQLINGDTLTAEAVAKHYQRMRMTGKHRDITNS